MVKKNKRKIIRTPHGTLRTPFFMPDATRGFVKLLTNEDLNQTGVEAMVVNTFHLYLQPGLKIIRKAGGVHNFMNWQKPLLSDSGGFQVFSLIHRNKNMGKIFDDRVEFRSPLDGSKHILTPEKSIQIQFDLGVDMMVCLDDCPPNSCQVQEMELALEHTIAWAKRSAREYEKQLKKRGIKNSQRPLLFCVIQGGASLELRKYCIEELNKTAPANGWDGYGFGAMPVNAEGKFLDKVLRYTANLIPDHALKFALGLGSPIDIARCVQWGWDMFDCVIPTREGRHGRLFVPTENYPLALAKTIATIKDHKFYRTLNIKNSKFKKDFSLASDLISSKANNYSKSYLHHLFKSGDPLGQHLASLNNLKFYQTLIRDLRK